MPSHQTPPVVPVSEDQLEKWLQFTRDRIRKGNLDLPTFQHILGHRDLTAQVDKMFGDMAIEYRQSRPLIERPAFMTVKLGTHKTVAELRQALLDAGNRISDYGDDILKRISLATELTEVDIVVMTVAELGFPNGATRQQIYDKALSFGFDLCPAEIGPQFRLKYADQPMNEWILVGMEPMSVSDGSLGLFGVGRDGVGRWLYGNSGPPGSVWNGSSRWAFRRKRPTA